VAGRACSADLDPFHQFITLLHLTAFNYSLLLDLLMSPETMFLLYLVRTVKHIAQCWTSWTRVCLSYDMTQRRTDDVLSTCRKRTRRGQCEPLLSDNENSSRDTMHVIGQGQPGHLPDCAVIGRRVESARSVKRLIVEYSSSSDDDDCTTDRCRVDASQATLGVDASLDRRGVDTSQDGRGVDASRGSACRTIINKQQQQQQRVDVRHSEHQRQHDEREDDQEDEQDDEEEDEKADDDEEGDEHEEEEKKDERDEHEQDDEEEDDDERVVRSDEQLRDTSDASTRSRDSSDASTLSRDSSTLSRVMSVLTQLTSVLSRLVANDMFPFDVQPLLRHLHRSQMLYRRTHPPT